MSYYKLNDGRILERVPDCTPAGFSSAEQFYRWFRGFLNMYSEDTILKSVPLSEEELESLISDNHIQKMSDEEVQVFKVMSNLG